MKKRQRSSYFVLLLIVAVVFFVVGSKMGNKNSNPTQIVLPPRKITVLKELGIIGSYPSTMVGKVKSINDKSITIQDIEGKQVLTLPFLQGIMVLSPYTKTKVPIAPIKTVKEGQMVELQVNISDKEIGVQLLHILPATK
ncbi:MAG: hypothetical protein Q7K55_06980 [Candidatus Levybacteria bacterium]|nr:hypothetical protein [Candidatus Levybacteria bacterium]